MATAWYKNPMSLHRVGAILLLSISITCMALNYGLPWLGFPFRNQWSDNMIIIILILCMGFGIYSQWTIKNLSSGMLTLGEKGGWVFIITMLTLVAFIAVLLMIGIKNSFGFFIALALSVYVLSFVIYYDFARVQAKKLRTKGNR